MDCSIRLAQIDTTLGNLEANLATHLEWVRGAVNDGVDLIVFPELSLTGYFLKDQTAQVALAHDAQEIQALLAHSGEVSIVVGFVERGPDERLYNAVAFLEDGEVKEIHRKVHLVTYGMFEDARDWAAGESFAAVESKHGRFGILSCEDAWHVGGAYLYFVDGVDALLIVSSGPGRGISGDEAELESNVAWRRIQDAYAFLFRTFVVYVNRVGWEDGVVFAGASRIVDPFGNAVAGPLGLDPGALDARLTSDVLRRARVQTPLRRDERPWVLATELARRVGLVAPDSPEGESEADSR